MGAAISGRRNPLLSPYPPGDSKRSAGFGPPSRTPAMVRYFYAVLETSTSLDHFFTPQRSIEQIHENEAKSEPDLAQVTITTNPCSIIRTDCKTILPTATSHHASLSPRALRNYLATSEIANNYALKLENRTARVATATSTIQCGRMDFTRSLLPACLNEKRMPA